MAMKNKNLIKGTFLYYDVENSNNRIYTKEMAEDIVKQFNERIQEGERILGQIGYPEPEQFEGRLGDVSHEVKEIHLNPECKTIEGTIEILETPKGNYLLKMIDDNIDKFKECFVVRSRGFGEVNENKEVTNFKILSFDIVSKESDAFKNNQ
jgi:hypothetical protein